MRFIALSVLLSGCAGMFAEELTFTTKHGIGIDVPKGDYGDDLSSVEIFDLAFDIVFDVAADRLNRRRSEIVETVVNDGMNLYMRDHIMSRNGSDSILGFYNFADVTLANVQPGHLRLLSHEMAHVLAWLLDGEDTADHPAGRWFNSDNSIDRLASHEIYMGVMVFQGLITLPEEE